VNQIGKPDWYISLLLKYYLITNQ